MPALTGIAFGVTGGPHASRFTSRLHFRVTRGDIGRFGNVAAMLGSVAISARYLPGARAAAVDQVTS